MCHIPRIVQEPKIVSGVKALQMIIENTRGLRILVDLNWDRVLYILTILFALAAGAWVGSL